MVAWKNAVNSPPLASSSDDSDFVSAPPKCHCGQQGAGPSSPAPQMDTVAQETVPEPKQVSCHFTLFLISTF
jgi:hypothetical protein